jgi:hypothetical protein
VRTQYRATSQRVSIPRPRTHTRARPTRCAVCASKYTTLYIYIICLCSRVCCTRKRSENYARRPITNPVDDFARTTHCEPYCVYNIIYIIIVRHSRSPGNTILVRHRGRRVHKRVYIVVVTCAHRVAHYIMYTLL